MRRTLAWRLYAIGFVQLIVLAASVAGVGWLLRPGLPPWPPPAPPGASMPRPPLHTPPIAGPLLTFLISGVVIVGVGSLLTARWIVRPLETLVRTARSFGSGDLNARTRLQRPDELGEVGRAFDEMADRLQALLLAERELLANVSHELRTPLARVRVALELAGETEGEEARASLEEVNTDLTEIEALIDDIMTTVRLQLAYGRAPLSGFPLHLERVAPRVLCDRAADRFRTRHPRRPLVVEVPEGLPEASADPLLFRRVLDNLLENANKYSLDPTTPVFMRASAHGAEVVIEVVDRGMGIAPDDLPRVFEPFFRSDRSRSRGTGGVGLGLTLAKRIVDAHGGAIDISGSESVGTTVHVTLRAAAPSGPSTSSPPEGRAP